MSLADLAFVELVPLVLGELKQGVVTNVVDAVEALEAVMLLGKGLNGKEHHKGDRP